MKKKDTIFKFILVALLCVALVGALTIGATSISIRELSSIIQYKLGFVDQVNETKLTVFWAMRLPRALATLLVGGSLAISGGALQGLFRNPLADPTLIGISGGAALAASVGIVLGVNIQLLGYYGLTFITFLGAIIAAVLVYRISVSNGKSSVTIMLLAGIAVNALSSAGMGLMHYLSDETQLRNLTFWLLGGMGGVNWKNLMVLIPFTLIPCMLIPRLSKQLNIFVLGEESAQSLGVNVSKLKLYVILLCTLAVGASVAISGMIGFIGLVIPHIIRLIQGTNHQNLLPNSFLMGAAVLLTADTICRTIISPTELPIGIVTAFIGTPLFLSLLVKESKKYSLAV